MVRKAVSIASIIYLYSQPASWLFYQVLNCVIDTIYWHVTIKCSLVHIVWSHNLMSLIMDLISRVVRAIFIIYVKHIDLFESEEIKVTHRFHKDTRTLFWLGYSDSEQNPCCKWRENRRQVSIWYPPDWNRVNIFMIYKNCFPWLI